jgi:hypothetical protein
MNSYHLTITGASCFSHVREKLRLKGCAAVTDGSPTIIPA